MTMEAMAQLLVLISMSRFTITLENVNAATGGMLLGVASTSMSAFRAAGCGESHASATSTSTSTTSCSTATTGVAEPYLSFPAQYCRFDVAAALANTLSLRAIAAAAAVEVAVEPGSTAAAHKAATAPSATSALSDQALPASVLGAVGMMSTLRYWGVEDELPLELVRYLLESEELSPPLSSSLLLPLSSSSRTFPGVDTNIDAGTTNTAVGETACFVNAQGTTPTASVAAASPPSPPPAPSLPDLIAYLAGEHREGDMFGFMLDLQQLRGMSAAQRLVYAACKGYLPLLRAVHKMLDKPLWNNEGLTCAAHAKESASTLGTLSRNAAIHGQLHVLQYFHDVWVSAG
jgi:hypothetical protein